MSIFIFASCVCVNFVSGARPSREWTNVLDQPSLEPNYGIRQPLPEDSKPDLTGECTELKNQLEGLGIRGEGNPCSWEGIDCDTECQVLSIVRSDAEGNLSAVEKFTRLQTLELTNTQVAGGLDALTSLINLQTVNLSGRKVSGDLGHLSELKNLKMLSLSQTLVAGDLRSLKLLTKLNVLDLSHTQVIGGFKRLHNLKSLEVLNLSHAGAGGGLAPLRTLTNLQVLDLNSAPLEGYRKTEGILALSNLNKLQKLDLGNTDAWGDLRSLQDLRNLQMLELGKTRVRGDLKDLEPMVELRALGLMNTEVVGDLASIQHLTNLRQLVLDNTGVHGDLARLQRLKGLQKVRLDYTKVSGNIAGLQTLTDLQWLWLHDTTVNGNALSLHGLTGLQKLDLGSTSVAANLTFVQELQDLRELCLDNMNLGGDLSDLENMYNIETLRLHHTKVGGDLRKIERLTRLQILKVHDTAVVGNLQSLRPLLDLHFLTLSETKVTGSLEDLRHLTKLTKLDLANTKVFGDIGSLKGISGLEVLALTLTDTHGDIVVLQNFKSLQRLSLHHTHVRGDLAAIGNLTKLTAVRLKNTKLTGHLEVFRHLTRLEYLGLINVEVKGDLTALSSMTALRLLELANTMVHGDITAIRTCTSLQTLSLSNTKVHGDFNVIAELDALRIGRLQGSDVTGSLKLSAWGGCCQHLQELSVADTQVGPLQPLQGINEWSREKPSLPSLKTLNVSGCSLNGSMEDFLFALAGSGISTLLASGCGLAGDLPNIVDMRAKVDGVYYSALPSPLAFALQNLDVSSNNLSSVEAVPAAVRVDLRNNSRPITLHRTIFEKAVSQHVELWLSNTQLANPEELQPLMSNELRLGESYTRVKGGFACRELIEPMLSVTPELFLPEQMCACRKGYKGRTTSCSPCPEHTFADDMDSPTCLPCPKNSTGPNTSTSWKACRCAFGQIDRDDDGTLSCQCPRGEALVQNQVGSEHCQACPDLKLICDAPGTNASTALVQKGHARLSKGSHEVYKCLDAARCEPSDCARGYMGRLCSDCVPRHHASRGECKPCRDLNDISLPHIVSWVLCGAGAVALIVAAAWLIRRKLADAEPRLKCAVGLLVPQLFALLQLVQLWGVLARLAQPPDDIDTADINATKNVTEMVEDSKSDAWASYLQILQVTAEELQGVLVLQCVFDGAAARMLFAVATPVLPLALLLACYLVELFTVGTGIQIGLRLLAVLFIGGASGAARLLECQRVDGTGKVSLEGFAFRRLMPHLLCTEAGWVDLVGKTCAVCYGVVIPSFLAFLFAKQHLVMRQTKTFVAYYKGDTQKTTLQLQMVSEADPFEEDAKRKRLVAAAAVFVALHVKGIAVVTLAKDGEAVIVEQVQAQVPERASADLASDLPVDLLVPQPGEAALLRSRGEIMRHNAMVQMLTERSILAEIQLKRSDRIMLGAKQLLCKYGSCQFVWMEVCVKVASAALVSVVDSKDGLWLSIAIGVGMALVVGITQPFVRPQENALHTFCFACLAVAAVGFRELDTWLTRSALVLPVLLLLATLARPDSQEALAMRLHEELEAKLPDGPVEVSTERLHFL